MKSRTLTLSDLSIVAVCALVAGSILLVRVQHYRAAARQSACSMNLRQLGLGFHNYHSAYKCMPMASGGTDKGGLEDPLLGNANRLSFFVGLSPFVEQQRLWEQIANPMQIDGVLYPPMGPVPWYDPNAYKPWGQRPKIYVCPSDPDAERFSTAASYVINYGDGIVSVGAPIHRKMEPYIIDRASKRGLAIREHFVKFRDILDGLSNTALLSEIQIAGPKVAKNIDGMPIDPSICIAGREFPGAEFWDEGRNACWADGSLLSGGFQTILPPSLPSATSRRGDLEGVMTASSHHDGGVHVLFADGQVRFVTHRVDAGDSQSPSVATARDLGYAPPGSPSPYGVWGAIGTRASKEVIDPNQYEQFLPPPMELDPEDIAEIKKGKARTWNFRDGNNPLRGWQVEVLNETTLVLLTEEDEVMQIALSSLTNEDAYHAVETSVADKLAGLRSLKQQIQKGLSMLERKQFDDFAELFMSDEQSKREMAATLPLQRGIMIQCFDMALADLENDAIARRVVRFDSSGNQVQIRSQQRLKLRRSGQRWFFTR